MKSDSSLDKLMDLPSIKNLGLKKDSISSILEAYEKVAFKDLLENGHIELGNGMTIEIVRLLERVHVLRGNSYKSSRRYKLKLTMDETVYQRIEEYYNHLEEEIS